MSHSYSDTGSIPLGKYESCDCDGTAGEFVGCSDDMAHKCADNQNIITFTKGGLPKEYVTTLAVPAASVTSDVRFTLDKELETRSVDGKTLKSVFTCYPERNELQAMHKRNDGSCPHTVRYTFKGGKMVLTRSAGAVTSVRSFNKV